MQCLSRVWAVEDGVEGTEGEAIIRRRRATRPPPTKRTSSALPALLSRPDLRPIWARPPSLESRRSASAVFLIPKQARKGREGRRRGERTGRDCFRRPGSSPSSPSPSDQTRPKTSVDRYPKARRHGNRSISTPKSKRNDTKPDASPPSRLHLSVFAIF